MHPTAAGVEPGVEQGVEQGVENRRRRGDAADWSQVPLVGFDTETTGTDALTERIVTAAFILPDGTATSVLVNPGVPIPPAATLIHGITDADAARGCAPRAGVSWIVDMLAWAWSAGAVVVGHNVSYDLTIAAAEARRHGLGDLLISGPVLDTYVLDKQLDRFRPGKRTLTALALHHRIAMGPAHDASADAAAAVALARVLTPGLDGMSPGQAHRSQQRWAAEQAASLQAYLRRTDPGRTVDGTWPIRRAGTGCGASP